MANFNKVIIAGNITMDPEKRTTPSGLSITKISVAMNRRWKDGDETREETTFVPVDSFGVQADLIAKMSKGDPILIEGRLRLDQWEDNGQKRSRLVVVLENFQYLKGKDSSKE
jgi:single-strand DNA-binding protein